MQHNETIFTFVSTQNSFQFSYAMYFAIPLSGIAISQPTNRVAGKTYNLNLNFNKICAARAKNRCENMAELYANYAARRDHWMDAESREKETL